MPRWRAQEWFGLAIGLTRNWRRPHFRIRHIHDSSSPRNWWYQYLQFVWNLVLYELVPVPKTPPVTPLSIPFLIIPKSWKSIPFPMARPRTQNMYNTRPGEGEYAIFNAKHKDLRGREDIVKSVTHQSWRSSGEPILDRTLSAWLFWHHVRGLPEHPRTSLLWYSCHPSLAWMITLGILGPFNIELVYFGSLLRERS